MFRNKTIELEIIAAYERGMPSTTLAKKHDVSTHQVLKLLRDNEVKIRNKGGKVKTYDEGWTQAFVKAYQDGETILSIADRFQVGQGTVWRGLQSAGIKTRPHGLRKATLRVPSDIATLAYFAGLLDGEGNLQFKHGGHRKTVGCKLAIYNTHTGVMDWLTTNIGGNVRWDTKRVEAHGSLACGIWEIYRARDVAALLNAALPYLIIKKQTAETALALFKEQFDL